MIIINDDPMKDHNITDDNIIYDITTDKSMKNNDVLKYIVSHDGELPQGTMFPFFFLYLLSNLFIK